MHLIKRFISFIFLLLIVTGCNKLYNIDLSSQIELTLSDQGYHYARRIHKYTDYDTIHSYLDGDLLDYLLNRTYTEIAEYFSDLSFTKGFTVGENNYSVKVRFTKIPPEKTDYVIEVLNSLGDIVATTIIKKTVDNDGVGHGFHENIHNILLGSCLLSFIDPDSGIECILKTEYTIEHTPGQIYYTKKKEKAKIDPYVSSSTTAHIGNKYFLYGVRHLDSKKKTKIYVIDTNLDGLFTNEDQVWFKDGPDSYFPFNEKIKVGWYEYIMDLTPMENENDKYILTIRKL